MSVSLTFKTGENREFAFAIVDKNGIPVNVATWAIAWQLRKPTLFYKDGYRRMLDYDAAAINKTTSSGVAVEGTYNVDPAQNTQLVVVTLDKTDSVNLTAGDYEFELWRTDDGFEQSLEDGPVTLDKGLV
jgi:hypothetical protein